MRLEEMLLRLALATLAGAFVGSERERQDRPAGLRTHILVCAGSALMTFISMELADPNGDRGRVAAQIVSGIGFLGAGTIFRYGPTVRGLTTAAGLWAVAGIGMAIALGGNFLYLGLATSALIFGVNQWLRALEKRWLRSYRDLVITSSRGQDALGPLLEEATRRGIRVQTAQWLEEQVQPERISIRLRLRLPNEDGVTGLSGWLSQRAEVLEFEWN